MTSEPTPAPEPGAEGTTKIQRPSDGAADAAAPASEAGAPLEAKAIGAPAIDFPVVGIGASAGGLEAFKTFLQAMPPDSGIAFVLVQHLDPTHESMMTDLLTKYTQMRVVQISDGMRLEANTVYMIPPKSYLFVKDGHLRLTDPVVRRGMRMPIDYLFRSMAESLQERAICIVLSGTGTDGTLGVRAVKGEGGTVLVQEPSTAQYDGMPRSAISTGVVDYVLPVPDMPKALMNYVQHAQGWYLAPSPEAQPVKADDLQSILALLRARTNHDFRCYKQGTLGRRIHRRMGLRQTDGYGSYLRLLREDAAEVKALLRDLLIGVTSFFRDPDAWQELEDQVLARLLTRKENNDHLRIWVAGCCSGEEAYSIAILAMELQSRLGKACTVQIFASDIDEAALETARTGLYPESIAADIAPERLRRYFDAEDGHYRVSKHIRDLVVFANQNLVRDPPFSRLDLISCRNLLIYLDASIQKRIIALLHFSLKEGGFLFLGPSESVAQQDDLFETVSKKWRIYRRIGVNQRAAVDFPLMPGDDDRHGRQGASLPREPRTGSITALAHEVLLQAYAPAAVLVNRRGESLYFHGPVSRFLEVVPGEPTRDVAEMSRDGLRIKVRSTLQRAIRESGVVSTVGRLRSEADGPQVKITVRPLDTPSTAEGLLLMTFEDVVEPPPPAPPDSAEQSPDELRQLEYELSATREDLQSTIEELETSNEELKASNEEVMSMNEELQSTNEELETSKEELQSLNEELTTVNNQLQDKVQDLEAANNDMANLLNSTSIATLFLDRSLQVRRFTPAATRLFRLIASDVGRHLEDIAKRFRNGSLMIQARQVLESLQPVERTVDAEDGGCFLCRILPYRTLDDRIDGVVLTFVDITERRRAEAALAHSEERLRLALAAVSDALWDWDLRTGVVFRSPRYYEIVERDATDQTRDFAFFVSTIHPDDRSEVLSVIDSHRRGASLSIDFTYRLARNTGPTKWLRARGRAVERDAAGTALRIVGTLADVTAQKESELQLLKLSQVVEQSPQSILITDLQGRIEYANLAVLNSTGYTPDQLVGKNPRLLQSGRTPREVYGALWQQLTSGASWQGEFIDQRKDGSEVVHMATISPIREPDGHVGHYAAVMFDITDRKRMEAELVQHRAHLEDLVAAKTVELERARMAAESANVAKTAFLANMSHEIRTPMNGVLGMATLLRRTRLDARQTDYLDKIESSGRHLIAIINDVLDLTKIEAGRVTLEQRDFTLTDLVQDVISITSEQIRRKGLAFTVDVPAKDTVVQGDRPRLTQALVNYIGNAVKFTDTGSITLRARWLQDDDSTHLVRFEVEDTGIGISEESRERLFSVFEQGDNSHTRRYGGTGLGLAIIKRIARMMGGDVGVDSTPGQGSLFWITVRLGKGVSVAEAPPARSAEDALAALQARHTGKSVLIVEDDAISAEVAKLLLNDAALGCDIASDGRAGIEHAQRRPYDLVLMDMQMPVLDGLEAASGIRALPGYATVPIVALTANAFEIDRDRCMQAGMNDFLSKPFDAARLYATVLRWLDVNGS